MRDYLLELLHKRRKHCSQFSLREIKITEMDNKGLEYERKIKEILIARGLLPFHLLGKLTVTGNDAGFVHKGREFFLEIKNRTAPDYGAKKIVYDPAKKAWKWNEPDEMSDLFDKIGVLKKIANFEPRKYVKSDALLTQADKEFDRTKFEQIIPLAGTTGASLLHEYYAKKNCFYIQVEGKGFYHLLDDRADLNVPKFIPVVALRLRAKPHSSLPIHNYSFRVVIVGARRSIPLSTHDIEDEKHFPMIK